MKKEFRRTTELLKAPLGGLGATKINNE